MDPLAELDQLNTCWCHQCHHDRGDPVQFMILCPTCGCKRCPHATHHQHQCTASNDAGQPGSIYGDYDPDPTTTAEHTALLAEFDATRSDRLIDFKRKHNLKED